MNRHKLVAEVCRILFGTIREDWVGKSENGRTIYTRHRTIAPKPGLPLYPLKRNTKQLIDGLKEALKIFHIDSNAVEIYITANHFDSSRSRTVNVLTDENTFNLMVDHTNNLEPEPKDFTLELRVPESIYLEKIKPYLKTRIDTENETFQEIFCRINKQPNVTYTPTINSNDANIQAINFVLNSLENGWQPSKPNSKNDILSTLNALNSSYTYEHTIVFDANYNRANVYLVCKAALLLCQLLNLEGHIQSYGSLSLSNRKLGINLTDTREYQLPNLLEVASSEPLELSIRLPTKIYQLMRDQWQKKLELHDNESLHEFVTRIPEYKQTRIINEGGTRIMSGGYFDSDDEYEGNRDNNDNLYHGPVVKVDLRGFDDPVKRFRKWLHFDEPQTTVVTPVPAAAAIPKVSKFFSEEEQQAKRAAALTVIQSQNIKSIITALKTGKFSMAITLFKSLCNSRNVNVADCKSAIMDAIDKLPGEVKEKIVSSEFYNDNFVSLKDSGMTLS